MDADVERIRSFNRTVTQRLGVLNERYLGRDRPLVESRLLFEIGTTGAAVRDLRARLGLDSGFFSRLLRSLERKGLAKTAKRGAEDGRVRVTALTRAGLSELARINALSDDLARSMLEALSEGQGRRLVAAMADVERLLRASSVEISEEDPGSARAQQCLEQYSEELAGRFPGGFDPNAKGYANGRDLLPPGGHLLVAALFGEPVGCGALRLHDAGFAEIKRMWVAPHCRGLGIGRRLLEALEQIARRRKMRAVRLDTHESLAEALNLYRSSGYRGIDRFNDNPYAHHWFEKTLA